MFGGQAGFGHHSKGGLVERVCRVVKVCDAQCGAIFSSRPTTHYITGHGSPYKEQFEKWPGEGGVRSATFAPHLAAGKCEEDLQ